MTKEVNKSKVNRSWAIWLLILSALFGVGASRVFSPLDDIKANTEANIRQDSEINRLDENDEDSKDAIQNLHESMEHYFDILNDKIDYSLQNK